MTAVADVVLPVAAQSEKTGSYVNWEGRMRPFEEALVSNSVSDHRALDMLASEMGFFLETRTQPEIHAQFEALGRCEGRPATSDDLARRVAPATRCPRRSRPARPRRPRPVAPAPTSSRRGPACSTPAGCRTASRSSPARRPPPSSVVSPASAVALGVTHGDPLTVTGPRGSVTLPVVVTEGMVDGVVWLPTNSRECSVRPGLGVDAGDPVTVTKGGVA